MQDVLEKMDEQARKAWLNAGRENQGSKEVPSFGVSSPQSAAAVIAAPGASEGSAIVDPGAPQRAVSARDPVNNTEKVTTPKGGKPKVRATAPPEAHHALLEGVDAMFENPEFMEKAKKLFDFGVG